MRHRLNFIGQLLLVGLSAGAGTCARAIPTPMATTTPESATRSTIDARALGIMEGMLKYCARVDAASVQPLQSRIRMISQGAKDSDVSRVRQSPSYRAAFEAVGAFVEKVDERNASRPCVEAIQRGPFGQAR